MMLGPYIPPSREQAKMMAGAIKKRTTASGQSGNLPNYSINANLGSARRVKHPSLYWTIALADLVLEKNG